MYPLDEGPKSGTPEHETALVLLANEKMNLPEMLGTQKGKTGTPEHGDGSGVDEEETRLPEMLSTQERKEGDEDVATSMAPGLKHRLDHREKVSKVK